MAGFECHCCPKGKGVFWARVMRVGLGEKVLFLCYIWNPVFWALTEGPDRNTLSPRVTPSTLSPSQALEPSPGLGAMGEGQAPGSRKPPAQGV